MAMTKLEEVARAMCRRAVSTWPEDAREGRTVEEIVDWDWRDWLEDSRAAVEALREPSEAMIDGAENSGAFDNGVFHVSRSTIAHALSSAINAVLSDDDA